MDATERHWHHPELLADALAEAYARGHAEGWADGAVAGAEGEGDACDTCASATYAHDDLWLCARRRDEVPRPICRCGQWVRR
jgi:hypothetical protein